MMMLSFRSLVVAAVAVLVVAGARAGDGFLRAAPLAQAQQDEVAISLRNAGVHPKLGLPAFVATSLDATMAAHARTVADVLWNDLDFEREFYLIPQASSASIPVAPATALPFDRWAELGADLVLVGSATASGSTLAIEMRMVSTKGESRGRQYFGVRYECGMQTSRGARDCAHQIADDFHKQTRLLDGVARTKLAFSSNRDASRVAGRPSQTAGQGKEIYLADYDGANQFRFTVNRSLNINPSWGPGGGLLAYTSYASGFPDIYVANLQEPGRALARPAHGTENVQNQLSSWSPDGGALALMSNRSGNNDIWSVNRDGSNLTRLTTHPANDGAPTWSPDGGRIAFTSDRTGANQLYVMNANGTGQQRLVDVKVDRPTWSTMNFIAFTMGSGPGYEIGIYDFNNPGAPIVLTSGVGSNESPAVAPNGRHIAFVTTRWGRKQIAVMDRTGQNVRRITEAGDNEHPTWQPFSK